MEKKHVEEARNEGVVIYGGGKRYKIKRKKYTLDAAIIGVDTDAKFWQDQKEILSTVIIAVFKNTGKGPTFFAFQRVGNFRMSDEERELLFHKVLGERKDDGWNRTSFANVVPYENKQNPNVYWVDPKVVVEIEYESLGNESKACIYVLSRADTKGHGRPTLDGKRLSLFTNTKDRSLSKVEGPTCHYFRAS